MVAATLGGAWSGIAAQRITGELGRAFELERAGRYARAADRYEAALARNPANLSALLGLERVLVPLHELRRLVPLIDSALSVQADNRSLRALDLRVWVALGEPDSLRQAAREWVAAMPDGPEPWSEWARATLALGDRAEAQRILSRGVERVGDAVLARDMAELSVQGADWVAAARQWHQAVRGNSSLQSSAVASLTRAPAGVQSRVVDVLMADPTEPTGGRLAAELLLAWDRPLEAWVILDRVLPSDRALASATLRRFADRARRGSGPEGSRARGFALERLAELAGDRAAERARIDAARAFVDAGDRQSAERMLDRIAFEAREGGRSAGTAVATLVGVMAESGRVEEAEARFRDWVGRLSPRDASGLRRQIAWAWIRRGDLDRAEGLVANDSSLTTAAVRGWVALYRGNLGTATELLRAAGPRIGTRRQATERTVMLALIQRIGQDPAPRLGAGLLLLARGDSVEALDTLEAAAGELTVRDGRADLLGYTGRIAVETRHFERADRVLRSVLSIDPDGVAAPAAEYYLARTWVAQGQSDRARDQLEHLILTFPESALLPLARRLFDQVRGGIPQ